ncbi:DUF1990 domain-containing protein [Bdellovibrio sp. SKB1291214]|uniref:DUF1990 family protein n=1 Tax=Bdellovibrio sp. SKB1291214 TaxID=1732569 RepID=UPI000B5172FE|nr:DUF1990 family protein [Bdellovibrio sp. SKB1291214]UYL07701.1 DUF1990 domain-containing protein [Bdellovibrio sp. SKB1291214]
MAKNLSWTDYKDQIKNISSLDYNYDVTTYHTKKDKRGWKIDRYHAVVGKEAPGAPVSEGPYERVRLAVELYHFPNPRLIRAVFDPHDELLGRNMYMIAHFMGMTFNFGVRVTRVIDEIKTINNTQMKMWGYSYRTLKGHFEVGEITFVVSKNLNTGIIDFSINAYSTPDKIDNLFYQTGFRVFGRPLQKHFAYSSIRRLKRIASQANSPNI